MNHHERRKQDRLQKEAITAIAVASETPFKTAFKIKLGIALAQLTSALVIFSGFTALALIAYWLLK
jgi:hypothetical protein